MPRNEDETRQQLINPALRARGWTEDLIQIERTPGGVDIIDGRPRRRKGRTDYRLCVRVVDRREPVPVALLEAKKEDEYPSLGMDQAQRDGRLHHVPFVFTTNGHLYVEYGRDTGQVRNQSLTLVTFPTPEELRARWETFKGIALSGEQTKPMLQPYKGGAAARWYFQDAAIRATYEKIAGGSEKSNRALLFLATGTGKTFIAVHLLYRLLLAGHLKRALFVCDRDELRTQAWTRMQAVFGGNARIVTSREPQLNAQVLIATYQTLNMTEEDDDPRFWKENYPPGTFSHIVIDECHRSAWKRWSIILTDNPDAVHIGLTATPRRIAGGLADDPDRKKEEEITANNIDYFGDPVFEYDIADGQNDGYLAACEIIRRTVDLDKKAITREDIVEASGRDVYTGRLVQPGEIQPRYTASQFESKLVLDDRRDAMCDDLFALLLQSGGPHQKTIIFCVNDMHASRIRDAINNRYDAWCRTNGATPKEPYAFQCTGNPNLRPTSSETIPLFRDSKSSHFIATTVDLLSTGVDIENLNNVVFFRYLQSPIVFYQMVGRGTRTGKPQGCKLMFRLYDYTNSTRLFGQPFISRPPSEGGGGGGGSEPPPVVRVLKDEFTTGVSDEGHAILVDGLPMPLEEYRLKLAERVQELTPTLDDLLNAWTSQQARRDFIGKLPGGETPIRILRVVNDQTTCDLFDVLAEVTYGVAARSRAERAASFDYKQRQWLKTLPDSVAAVLTAIANEFARGGIEELETPSLFDADAVKGAGGHGAFATLDAAQVVEDMKRRLLAP